MEMIRQVSTRPSSPLISIASGSALQTLLRDLDVMLAFAFIDYPRQIAGTPPEAILGEVGGTLLARLRRKRAYLVIDHSDEGYAHSGEFSELLHAWCGMHDVSATTLILVNTNTVYPRQYAAWCEDRGIVERYAHVNINAYAYRLAVAIEMLDWREAEPTLLHPGPRPYRFLSFNHAPRPHRILAARHLLSVEPPDSLVSLGTGKLDPEVALRNIAASYGKGRLRETHPGLLAPIDLGELQSRMTLEPPGPESGAVLAARLDLHHYADSYVSVVTETEMSNGQLVRVSEKALKPFLFGHLAIVAGNPGSLACIREMGFQTFHPSIDEGYDEITNHEDRLSAVLGEMDRLRALDGPALHGLFLDLADLRRANLLYGRDVLSHRLRIDAQTALTNHVLDRARVSVGALRAMS